MADSRMVGQGMRRRMGAPMSHLEAARDDEPERDGVYGCQACGGSLTELGTLGQRTWHRCRDCGLEQSTREMSFDEAEQAGFDGTLRTGSGRVAVERTARGYTK